jgi:hypothetical protein
MMGGCFTCGRAAEGIGGGLGGVRTSETCTTSRRAKMFPDNSHVLGFMANPGTRKGFLVLLVGALRRFDTNYLCQSQCHGRSHLSIPNVKPDSIESTHCRDWPQASSNGTSAALPQWQAGRLVVMLIPVPDWPSLIKPRWVQAPAFLSLYFCGGRTVLAQQGKGEFRPAALSHSTVPHTCLLPFLDSSTPPKDRQADSATVLFCVVRLPPQFLTESTRRKQEPCRWFHG